MLKNVSVMQKSQLAVLLVMVILLGWVAKVTPTGFVPSEDQGYSVTSFNCRRVHPVIVVFRL